MTDYTAYSVEEFIAHCEQEEQKERQALKDRNLVLVDEHNGKLWITLNDIWDTRPNADLTQGAYDISVDRITNPTELVEWLYHLKEKNWFTPQMESDFITEAFRVAVPRPQIDN